MSSFRVTTDEYTLVVEDNRFDLRQHESVNEESWTNARRGDMSTAPRLVLRANGDRISVIFGKQDIGAVAKTDTAMIGVLADLVEYYNTEVGPTDANTAKTAALLKHQTELQSSLSISVQAITWNTHGGLAKINPSAWSMLDSAADLIILSFQETDALNRNVVSNSQTLSSAISATSVQLSETHELFSTVQLLGLMTLAYVKKSMKRYIDNVTTDSSGTGFLRIWGNKGAVLTRFSLLSDSLLGGGADVYIVNCHLSAGEQAQQNLRRRWELKEIAKKFHVPGLVARGVVDIDSADPDSTISDVSSEDEPEDEVEPSRYNRHKKPLPEVPLYDESDHKEPSPPLKPLSHAADTNGTSVAKHVHFNETDAGVGEILQNDDEKLDDVLGRRDSVTSVESDGFMEGEEVDSPDKPKFRTRPLVIVMGDLNYRVKLDHRIARQLVEEQNYETLIRYDNLTKDMQAKRVLLGFKEGLIGFPPTYKYEVGTNRYVTRVPSYTDRVLFRTTYPALVTRYDSILNYSSDHLPVDSTFTVEVDALDENARSQVIEETLRLVDKAENDAQPRIEAEPLNLEASGSIIGTISDWLVLKYTGNRSVKWSIVHGPDIRVRPSEGTIDAKHPQMRVLVKSVMKVSRPSVSDVLIIRPEGGSDSFVTVEFKADASILGSSLDEMIIAGQSTPKNDSKSGNMPPQIWNTVDYLRDRVVPDMFVHDGEPSIMQQVLGWLDSNTDFDREVLDNANTTGNNAGIYSVVAVLKALLANLPTPLIPPEVVSHHARGDDMYGKLPPTSTNVIIYLVAFFQHTFKFGVPKLDNLPRLATMLMGDEGNQEKRIALLLELLANN